ncbi:MAG: OmpA family protein [Saprospiraceae bacterium]|nr:OmpA family protein [Saprospiraceae bacterium]
MAQALPQPSGTFGVCREPNQQVKTVTAMFRESKIIQTAILCTFSYFCWGQGGAVIQLANPSFEGVPGAGIDIPGWYNCGPGHETPPDLQPGFFNVKTMARHGNTYLGLVVRQTGTWESVGQRLSQPLDVNQCYEFSLDLRRDTSYESPLASSTRPVRFTTPAKIIIWGGNGYCHKGEVLYQSSVIIHPRWLTYGCRLSPKKGTWSHIIIEAYYGANDPFNPTLPLYSNGNILIDNATPIRQITCGPEKMPEGKKKPALTRKGPEKTPTVAEARPTPVAAPAEPVKKPKRGRSYRLDVYFKADAYTFDLGTSEKGLEDLYNMLKNDENISVEIGGHTNNNLHPYADKAMDLSTKRAKSVADWLISKGVSPDRVQYKGYGWTKPVEPNTTPEGRKRNQRVEVTILTYN